LDKYTQASSLTCDIVTEVGTQPRIFQRLNRLPIPVVELSPNEERLELANGNVEVFRLGEDRRTIKLGVTKLSAENVRILEEVRRRGLRIYIYPHISGSIQAYYPLCIGYGGDSKNLSYNGSIDANTVVYIPEADAGAGWYLKEYDYETGIFSNNIPTAAGTSAELTLGRGALLLRPRENSVDNSLLGDVTSGVPADWDYTEPASPPTTGGVITSGWMGVPAVWTSDRHFQWRSDLMTCPPAGKYMAFSYGWRCDGSIEVALNFVGVSTTTFTHTAGSGYEHQEVEVPAGACLGIRLEVNITAGSATYGEFTAPQLVKSDTEDIKYYPAFMGSSGTGTTGEIDDTDLEGTGTFGADLYHSEVAVENDTAVMISGLVAPLYPVNTDDRVRPVFTLRNNNTGNDVMLAILEGSTSTKITVYQNNVLKAEGNFTHTLGSEYVAALVVGFNNGTYTVSGSIREVGGTSTTTCTATAGLEPLCHFNMVTIGTEYGSEETANGIISEVVISAADWDETSTAMERLSDTDNLDMYRMTRGRLFSIIPQLSPSPWERKYWDGRIVCEQVKVL